MAAFKVPEVLPQDLLLISEFVDAQERSLSKPPAHNPDEDIASSGSENESEEEIEKDLTALEDEDEGNRIGNILCGAISSSSILDSPYLPRLSGSSSSSESEPSSESDSDAEGTSRDIRRKGFALDEGEDEDTVPAVSSYLQTKNEVVGTTITVPESEEVGTDEELEKVGEVLSIIGDTVIVKGLPSERANRGSEKALDSDTLLVFSDRKVMGYIFETFGPTLQPLYQIRFNSTYTLNTDKVQVGREVFHIPRRSRFVFVSQLKQFKGSDASNVHDEEPGEDELEFSDDEAEAVHRSRLKRKRGGDRARSVSSSRYSTPAPSQMRGQDMMTESVLNKSAFDERGPYDLDYEAGPSRPMPKPYDDPYSDAYTPLKFDTTAAESSPCMDDVLGRPVRPKDRGSSRSDDRSGRGRGRGRGKRGGSHQRAPNRGGNNTIVNAPSTTTEAYDPRMPQESPPSPYIQAQNSHPFNFVPDMNAGPPWVYPDQTQGQMQSQHPYMFPSSSFQTPYAQHATFAQPHINPLFASAFGFQTVPGTRGYPPTASGSRSHEFPVLSTPEGRSWAEQWAVPSTGSLTGPKDDGRSS
ncbi:H/ACA ribonucleoprotein complex non-core subunit NAF1 [Leucoagaricus sp. SymC.cos]|nr:H/ACA ribonucleoprotein complex non-core subunit NAF1 [Leucoagaricus sp. SymC.cos]